MSLNSKPPSVAQLWARERNMTKGQLLGIVVNLKRIARLDSITSIEATTLRRARAAIDQTLDSWERVNPKSKNTYIEKVWKGG